MRNPRRTIGIVAITIFVLAVVGVVMLPTVLGWVVGAKIIKIKAQGDPVSIADLSPSIPDAENGAVIYENIFAEIEKPEVRMAIEKAYKGTLLVSPKREDWQAMRATVQKYRHLIPVIEEAASRPECAFKIEWTENIYDTEFYHCSKMRNLSRLLATTVVVDAHDGHTVDALREIDFGFRLSNSLNDEPAYIGLLARMSSYAITSRSMQQAILYAQIDEAQAKYLFDLLGSINPHEGYLTAMKGERAVQRDALRAMSRMLIAATGESDPRRASRSLAWRMLILSNEGPLIDYMNSLIEEANSSYRELGPNALAEPKFPKYALLAETFVWGLERGILKRDEFAARVDGDRLFLALLAYKDRFGEFPESLYEAEKGLGWKLPKEDVFSGKPFRYRREGAGFVLYSIGSDLKDDGGEVVTLPVIPEKKPSAKPLPPAPPSPPKVTPPTAAEQERSRMIDKYPNSLIGNRRSADLVWMWPLTP
ncbi:MAG: hypothetical protein ACYC2Y_00700 [Armatimonadota bacterium]